jgi:quercetin dioxygenase-like cupin family protein
MNDINIKNMPAGTDWFGEKRSLGISTIDFKFCPTDGNDLLILENTFHAKGGPPKHLHYSQNEWFYCLEGEFSFEVGSEKHILRRGDCLLGPKNVPHVWAYIGDNIGKILIAFSPAGKMEDFFRKVTKTSAMPSQDPALWRTHGMELLGPPMNIVDAL